MRVDIIPSELRHVRMLSRCLREKDQKEAEALGVSANRALYYSYRYGLLRRTAFVDGDIAAMWGVGGTPMSIVGRPYLITSPACERVSPLRFARIYKDEAQKMSQLFPVLENYVHSDYKEAIKMLHLAGFQIGPEIKINGNSFNRFRMVNHGS